MPIVIDTFLQNQSNYLSVGGSSFQYVYDCIENRFEYLSPNFEEVTGHKVEECLHNPEFILTHYHVFKDIIFKLKIIINEFATLFRDYFEDYTLFYYIPLLHKNGKIYPCLVQGRILELTNKGEARFVFANSQIINKNYNYRKPFNISFISNDVDLPSLLNIESFEALHQAVSIHKLSSREIEILKLVSEGDSNNTISNKLNISIHTISTHKKNIISKTNTQSIMVTIQRAILQKII